MILWGKSYKLVGGFWVRDYKKPREAKNLKRMLKTFELGRK